VARLIRGHSRLTDLGSLDLLIAHAHCVSIVGGDFFNPDVGGPLRAPECVPVRRAVYYRQGLDATPVARLIPLGGSLLGSPVMRDQYP